MTGIKLTFDDVGDANVQRWQPEELNECLVECDLAGPDWTCEHTGKKTWDYWHDPGWCPLFKWHKNGKFRDMMSAKETGVTFMGFNNKG